METRLKGLRRVWERWFLAAPGAQTIFETLALGGLLTLLSATIYGPTFTSYYSVTFLFFVNPICALYYGLRMRVPAGLRRRRRLAVELPYLAAVCTVIGGIGVTVVMRINDYYMPLDENSFAPLLIISVVLAFPFAFFRTAVRLWMWWRGLCERHLIWSLMNSHLLALALVQAAVIVPVMILLILANDLNWLGSAEMELPIRNLLYRLSTTLPLLGVAILLSIAILSVLLPASAVVSYFFARRIKRRLDVLVVAAHAARDGDYQARVLVSGQDEISALQTDFNTMITSLEAHVGALQAEREKVSELLKLRRELLANVSHELRTPVATLRGYLDSSTRRGAELSADDLAILQRETEALGILIDDLFTLSRAETDHLSMHVAPTDTSEVIARVVETAAPMAWRDKRVEVSADIPPDLPLIEADAGRLEQALRNLIHNSLRHTLPGGLVMVGASQSDCMVEIAVRDTGEGIAPDALPHIWERFYRDAEHGGTGLGLALVKSFIEGMGGTVSVESTPGEGACFTLALRASDKLQAASFTLQGKEIPTPHL